MRHATEVSKRRSGAGAPRWVLLAALLTLGVAACVDPLGPEAARLERAERLWAENRPGHYTFTYQRVCFCPLAVVSVEVLDGEVVAVEWAGPGEEPEIELEGHTIDELFDRTRSELERDPFRATLEFDPALGHPTSVYFDYEEHVADEEWGFQVEDFTIVP